MCVSGEPGPFGFPGRVGATGATGATGPTIVDRKKRQAGCPGELCVFPAVTIINYHHHHHHLFSKQVI